MNEFIGMLCETIFLPKIVIMMIFYQKKM